MDPCILGAGIKLEHIDGKTYALRREDGATIFRFDFEELAKIFVWTNKNWPEMKKQAGVTILPKKS